jgi:hypothetical protein
MLANVQAFAKLRCLCSIPKQLQPTHTPLELISFPFSAVTPVYL